MAVCYEIIANTTTTSTTTTHITTTTTTTIKKRPITCANKTKQLSQWLQTNVIIFRLVSRKLVSRLLYALVMWKLFREICTFCIMFQ